MPLVEIVPKALLVEKIVPRKGAAGSAGQVDIKTEAIDVQSPDMEIPAQFISKSPRLGVFLVPFKYIRSSQGDGYERVPNTGVRIVFKGFRREVWNSRLLDLILKSKAFRSRKIMIDPDDTSGFWQKQGWLTKREIKVVDKELVPSGAAEHIDLSKAVK